MITVTSDDLILQESMHDRPGLTCNKCDFMFLIRVDVNALL